MGGWRATQGLWIVAVLSTGCGGGSATTRAEHQGIIGGEETTEWPAVVALLLADSTILCSGTLIDPSVVLTAAHCGTQAGPGDLVYFGSSVFAAGELLEVDSVEVHPDYDGEDPRHDLAILFLTEESDVTPVSLALEGVDSSWTGTVMHAVGFGNADSYAGETGGIKREVDVDISGVDSFILYHETPGQNTCSGDSGGPLFVEDGDGWSQVAVASFVYPLETYEDYCSGGGGDVRLDKHLEWLDEVVELGLEIDTGDDDDDTGEGSYLEDDEGGCGASFTGRRTSSPCALLFLLGLLWVKRARASKSEI